MEKFRSGMPQSTVMLFATILIFFSVVMAVPNFAVYSMTGDPIDNHVNIWVGDQNANLIWVKQVSTGVFLSGSGTPQAGFNQFNVLLNQNSVVVSGMFLFVVNPAANSFSMFVISASDPTAIRLTAVGKTSTFPISLTVANNVVCVLSVGGTGGSGTSQVQCFSFSSSQFSLGRIVASTSLNSINAGASQISFSKDCKALLVSTRAVGYNGTSGTFPSMLQIIPVTWIDLSTIVLGTPVSSASPGAVAWPFAEGPAGTVLLSDVHPLGNAAVNSTVYLFTFNTGTSPITLIQKNNFSVPGQKGVCWMTWSPLAGTWFTGNGGSSFSEIAFANGTLSLVRSISTPNSGGIVGDMTVVSLPGYDFVIGTHPSDSTLSILRVSPTGARTVTASAPLNPAPNKMNGIAAYLITYQSPSVFPTSTSSLSTDLKLVVSIICSSAIATFLLFPVF